jgi:DNA (cytosine-5)-methyltransferase 1
MQLISLFSGIGGFELAAEKMGWQVLSTCEKEEFPRRILKYYWPNAYHHDDVRTLNIDLLDESSTKYSKSV